MTTPETAHHSREDAYDGVYAFLGYFCTDDQYGEAAQAERVDRFVRLAHGDASIADLRTLRDNADLAIWTAVQRARKDGATWDSIGAEVGLSAQGAEQKYGR